LRVQGFQFGKAEFRVSGLGCIGSRVEGLGLRVKDLGLRVSGLGFQVKGLGF
jgi:hypothetical protein